MRRYLAASLVLSLAVLPSAAFAACNGQGLCNVLGKIGDLIQTVTPIVVALALLAFFWGLAMYMFHLGGGEAEKDKKKGRDLMIYGIITLFVIVSVWGLVQLLSYTIFGTSETTAGPPPLPYLIQTH